MVIDVDVYQQIRSRFLNGESQRKIAKDLGISRKTVKKYSEGGNFPWEKKTPERTSSVLDDEKIMFIEECLDEDKKEGLKKQTHSAKKIFDRLVVEKGYKGGESTVRRKVRELKEKRHKAFIPLQFEPGEALQVDWGEATIYLTEKREKVHLFCARLCYSCKPIVRAYSHQKEECFLDAYVRIFKLLQGVPARVIFDNAKVAVKEGFGAHARKQESYSKLCAHYGFEAVFCNAASGHEKGLVEGLVGWARRNILVPVPHVDSLEELNEMLEVRCTDYEKRQIKGKPDTVGAMFEIEKAALRPLPTYPFETAKSENARVSACCTVRFETNEYSVPAEYVRRYVGIKAYPETVEIYCDGRLIASHPRLWGKSGRSCRLADYIGLLEQRGRAVLNAVPVKQNLSEEAYEELKANINNPQKVSEILRREASLPPEEKQEQKEELPREDPVKIKKVNLHIYETLMDWAEGNRK